MSGKAVYFTALFPYFVLLILGARAWMLPGAINGIKYYVTPDWSRLFDIHVWSDAASKFKQVLYFSKKFYCTGSSAKIEFFETR